MGINSECRWEVELIGSAGELGTQESHNHSYSPTFPKFLLLKLKRTTHS